MKVLVVFNAGATVYGLERSVIELFDRLRPEVESVFLMSRTTDRMNLPILQLIRDRNLNHAFFSDTREWPRIGKPRSVSEAWRMLTAAVKGNWNILNASRKTDVIYIPGVSYLYFAFVASFIYRLSGRKVVYQFHELIDHPSTKLRGGSFFLTDLVHSSDLGLQVTVAANRYLKKKRNHVIPCSYAVTVADDCELSDNGRMPKRNILFIGQVSKYKGVDILLDAFDRVRSEYQDVVLNIVGGCDDPALATRLTNANSDGSVKWWGYREDVRPFLKDAYLYVQPSPPSLVHESFGIGLVEAMAAGLPAVCFRSGAFQEVMVHEQTGIICEDEDPASLAQSIERLLSDKEFRDQCGRSARMRFRECYSQPEIKSRWLTLLGCDQTT